MSYDYKALALSTMWMFFNDGFISIVADKAEPTGERLLVRSRARGHIEAVFKGASVFTVPQSDYAYRAWVHRSDVAAVVADRIENLSYTNFKNSIRDHDYHDAAMGVWGVMYDYQADQRRQRPAIR